MKKPFIILLLVFVTVFTGSIFVSASDDYTPDAPSTSTPDNSSSQSDDYTPDSSSTAHGGGGGSWDIPADAKISLDEDDSFIIYLLKICVGATNTAWENISDAIVGGSTLPGNNQVVDIYGTAQKFEGVFKTFAYSICVLFIGLNMLATAVKYEIMTLKGGAGIVLRVLFAKIWIDLSYDICKWIIEINDGLVSQIISTSQNNVMMEMIDSPIEESGIWVIGPIIDFFNTLVALIPLFLISITMLIAGSIITIKLLIRSIEIALMVTVAPPFFACLGGGESTQRYFRNYMTTFVSIVVQTIFMAIVYGLATNWWVSISSDQEFGSYILSFLPNLGVVIVLAVMIVKPPKILTNLIK